MRIGHFLPLIPFLLSLTSAAFAAEDTDWLAVGERLPRVNLREEYHPICRGTCEYVGFSFSGPREELLEMRAAGANAVGLGAMWRPIPDPNAPYGCGVRPYTGYGTLEQTFRAEEPFDGFAPCLPTGHSTDSGCDWEIFRDSPSPQPSPSRGEGAGDPSPQPLPKSIIPRKIDRGEGAGRFVAGGTWENVVDNSWPEALFPEQEPGTYRFRISAATGTWIGWWGRDDNPYPDGNAVLGSDPNKNVDLEFRLRVDNEWRTIVPGGDGHRAFPLGPSPLNILEDVGLSVAFSVGNWNNPGFPYYPDWFWEKFPDAAAVDQNGSIIEGGMFGKSVPAPGIEHPVIVNGTTRYIRTVVGELIHSPVLAYWVMGGEAMYATYGYQGRWTDYSENAIVHFRRWLAEFRYASIDELNEAWGARYKDFDAVEAPREPSVSQRWLDWLDFRFASMGERFAWHYRAVRSTDPERLVLTCNHGSLYHGISYAEMGARPEIYAAVSDGFETGQIMNDSDPDLYNLLYTESLCGLGKPYAPVRLAYKKSDPKARGGGTSYTPEAARRYVYESLGAGAWHLGLIQWSGSLPDGEWGVRGTPAEEEIEKLFGEIRTLRPFLDDAHALRPAVGVFLSHPTWALRGFLPAWQKFHVAAVESQIPKIYVYDHRLLSGDLSDIACIVSMDNSILGEGIPEALLDYARHGGRLVVAGSLGGDASGISAPIPEELAARRSTNMGKGSILFLEDPSAKDILAALEGSDVPAVRPVRVRSQSVVRRRTESLIAMERHDLPQDLASAETLGQTVRVDREGLRRIAIRMPTYFQVPPAGFTLTAREEGPEGRVLARHDFGPGIGDNSWVELPLESAPAVGTVLYLEAEADEALPPTNLGWWSTRSDIYAGGTAWVDGKPVEGDRQVKLVFDEPVPARRAVEAFVLTDGLNFGVVLVNTAENGIDVEIDPAGLPFPLSRDGYSVSCPLDRGRWKREGLTGRLTLDAHGTAFLWVERGTTDEEVEAVLAEARRRKARWDEEGALMSYGRYALARAEPLAREGRNAKALASALRAVAGPDLIVGRIIGPWKPGEFRYFIEVRNPEGEPVDPDGLAVEVVPSSSWLPLHPQATDTAGRYRLVISPEELSPVYSYAGREYAPEGGPLQLRVTAVTGRQRTSEIIQVETMAPERPGLEETDIGR